MGTNYGAWDYVWIGVVFLSAIILHEVAHGLVALWNGDDTAKRAGRLTLNPLPHMDVLGTIFLVFVLLTGFGIGWAKPVPIDPRKFGNFRLGLFTVALAGPLTNVLLAGLSLLIAIPIIRGAISFPGADTLVIEMFIINLLLASFNLVPVPPLDGSRIVSSALPAQAMRGYLSVEPYGIMIILALLFLPVPWLHAAPLRFLLGKLVGEYVGWFDAFVKAVS
ncbi:MAG: site-2 protease family protein [bacterium]